MSSTKHKLRLALTCAMLLTSALTISCTGFFVNPTLSTITVVPQTPSISQGATQQMTATGTYQDGSTSTLTGGTSCSGNTVCWSSSDTTVATISTSGVLTGVAQGTSTISAASGAVTGTTSANIVLGDVTGLVLSPTSYTVAANDTVSAYAYAQTPSGQVDVSATATWTTGSSTTATVVGGDPAVITGVAAGTTTVTATYTTSTAIYTATANVTVQ